MNLLEVNLRLVTFDFLYQMFRLMSFYSYLSESQNVLVLLQYLQYFFAYFTILNLLYNTVAVVPSVIAIYFDIAMRYTCFVGFVDSRTELKTKFVP